MDQVTELTKAWIAGFFDGEGCVSIHMQAERRGRASDSLGLTIQLSNTSLVTLETIRTAYGGRIHRKKGYKNRQQCYSWQVCGALSDIFVRAILPYSKVKLPQLELYLHARTLFAKMARTNMSDSAP